MLIGITKIKNIILKNQLLINEIIWLIILFIYFCITNDYKLYFLLNNILIISILLSFIFVNFIRSKFVDKNFMKRIKSSYIIFIIILLFNFIEIWGLFKEIDIYCLLFLYSIQYSLEGLEINNIFKLNKYKWENMILYVTEGVYIGVAFLSKYLQSINIYYYSKVIIISNIVINILFGLVTIYKLIKYKLDFNKYEYRKSLIYMISIVFSYISFLGLIINRLEIIVLILVFKSIAFYKAYDIIINKVLDLSLKKITNELSVATITKKELNSILKKRNTILNETNLMIQKSNDLYNELVDSIYGGIFLFSSDTLQYVNKRAVTDFNINFKDVIGEKLDTILKKYFYISLDEVRALKNCIPSLKLKNIDVEIFLIDVDKITKLIYVHDISEINENNKAKSELEEFLKEEELKKKFFANVSHELKTPINMIFSAIQMNKIHLEEENLIGFDKNRKIIQQNCLRLIRTINNFIDANKVSEGYIIPDSRVYNIVEIIENVSIACNKYIELAKINLTFDSEDEEIYVKCDKEMITRIMLNIISNSVKYGVKGGKIDINIYNNNENSVIIKVINNGIKIDESTIPYIFDKFTKINKAFNRLKEGSGLGLFLTKALVELQGGSIELISNDNGNEFIIIMDRTSSIYEIDQDENIGMNALEEKVDVEFSDIYID